MHKHREVIQERKKREKDQRIQSILSAAKKVFFSKGYQRTTMDEIAFEAEISKPTIYQYFKTKDELYSALMLPFLEEFGSYFERIEKKLIAKRYATGKSLVKDFFNSFLKSYRAAPDSLRVANTFFQHADLIDELNQDTRLAISSKGRYDFELARGILETAIAQGLIRRINPYALSDIIWGLLLGITQVMDMKATKHTDSDKYLKSTLAEAEKLLTDAIVLK
ncbi:MAG TPA: TetR/AcrR family transcriptional regulator [Desulfomonilia bacterium]|nr:TetR/AcrR family transcriptional regulator [Desulfomonilia bacterium]